MVFPLAMSSILSFLQFIQQLLTSYSSSSRHFYIFFNNVFQKTLHTSDVNNPVSLPCVIACRVFFASLSLGNTSFFTRLVQLILSILPTFKVFVICFPKYPNFSATRSYAPKVRFKSLFLKIKSNLLVRRFFLLNAAFAMTTLDLIPCVHLASFVIRLAKYF